MDFITNISQHKAEAVLDFTVGLLLTEVHAVVSSPAIDKVSTVFMQIGMALISGAFIYTGREVAKGIHNYFKRRKL